MKLFISHITSYYIAKVHTNKTKCMETTHVRANENAQVWFIQNKDTCVRCSCRCTHIPFVHAIMQTTVD